MSEKLGTISYGSDNNEVFLGKNLGKNRNFSEEVASLIDKRKLKTLLMRHTHNRS